MQCPIRLSRPLLYETKPRLSDGARTFIRCKTVPRRRQEKTLTHSTRSHSRLGRGSIKDKLSVCGITVNLQSLSGDTPFAPQLLKARTPRKNQVLELLVEDDKKYEKKEAQTELEARHLRDPKNAMPSLFDGIKMKRRGVFVNGIEIRSEKHDEILKKKFWVRKPKPKPRPPQVLKPIVLEDFIKEEDLNKDPVETNEMEKKVWQESNKSPEVKERDIQVLKNELDRQEGEVQKENEKEEREVIEDECVSHTPVLLVDTAKKYPVPNVVDKIPSSPKVPQVDESTHKDIDYSFHNDTILESNKDVKVSSEPADTLEPCDSGTNEAPDIVQTAPMNTDLPKNVQIKNLITRNFEELSLANSAGTHYEKCFIEGNRKQFYAVTSSLRNALSPNKKPALSDSMASVKKDVRPPTRKPNASKLMSSASSNSYHRDNSSNLQKNRDASTIARKQTQLTSEKLPGSNPKGVHSGPTLENKGNPSPSYVLSSMSNKNLASDPKVLRTLSYLSRHHKKVEQDLPQKINLRNVPLKRRSIVYKANVLNKRQGTGSHRKRDLLVNGHHTNLSKNVAKTKNSSSAGLRTKAQRSSKSRVVLEDGDSHKERIVKSSVVHAKKLSSQSEKTSTLFVKPEGKRILPEAPRLTSVSGNVKQPVELESGETGANKYMAKQIPANKKPADNLKKDVVRNSAQEIISIPSKHDAPPVTSNKNSASLLSVDENVKTHRLHTKGTLDDSQFPKSKEEPVQFSNSPIRKKTAHAAQSPARKESLNIRQEISTSVPPADTPDAIVVSPVKKVKEAQPVKKLQVGGNPTKQLPPISFPKKLVVPADNKKIKNSANSKSPSDHQTLISSTQPMQSKAYNVGNTSGSRRSLNTVGPKLKNNEIDRLDKPVPHKPYKPKKRDRFSSPQRQVVTSNSSNTPIQESLVTSINAFFKPNNILKNTLVSVPSSKPTWKKNRKSLLGASREATTDGLPSPHCQSVMSIFLNRKKSILSDTERRENPIKPKRNDPFSNDKRTVNGIPLYRGKVDWKKFDQHNNDLNAGA